MLKKFINCFVFILMIFVPTMTLIASEHLEHNQHSETYKTLLWPAVNFSILLLFMFIKLRKPLSEMFQKRSIETKDLYFSASKKEEVANKKYEEIHQKFRELGFLRENAMKKSEKDLKFYKKNAETTIKTHIQKQKKELSAKILSEKKKKITQLQNELLSDVVLKTKNYILKDSKIQFSITNSLVKKIDKLN